VKECAHQRGGSFYRGARRFPRTWTTIIASRESGGGGIAESDSGSQVFSCTRWLESSGCCSGACKFVAASCPRHCSLALAHTPLTREGATPLLLAPFRAPFHALAAHSPWQAAALDRGFRISHAPTFPRSPCPPAAFHRQPLLLLLFCQTLRPPPALTVAPPRCLTSTIEPPPGKLLASPSRPTDRHFARSQCFRLLPSSFPFIRIPLVLLQLMRLVLPPCRLLAASCLPLSFSSARSRAGESARCHAALPRNSRTTRISSFSPLSFSHSLIPLLVPSFVLRPLCLLSRGSRPLFPK
jgi:hypothetical protein